MTKILKLRWTAALAVSVLVVVALAGCKAGNYDTGVEVDGTLWRQISSFEDPLAEGMFSPSANASYLGTLAAKRWDGSDTSVADLKLAEGGAVVYGVTSTPVAVEYSVFIASGQRSDALTDDGEEYDGPSTVFTCYGIYSDLSEPHPVADREIFTECPRVLVEELANDAFFASGEEFDG